MNLRQPGFTSSACAHHSVKIKKEQISLKKQNNALWAS